jgi:hypothetical protein
MTQELEQLQQEMVERQIWYAFYVSHRDVLNCDANKSLLDNWLTANLKVLSADSLDEAYAATSEQLAKRRPGQPQPQVTHVPVAESLPTVQVEAGPDAEIPANITRKVILKMEKDDYKALLKRYGAFAIQHRVNKV